MVNKEMEARVYCRLREQKDGPAIDIGLKVLSSSSSSRNLLCGLARGRRTKDSKVRDVNLLLTPSCLPCSGVCVFRPTLVKAIRPIWKTC